MVLASIRWASPADIPRLVELLTEAATWARARGIERWWPVPFPSEWVERRVARSEVAVLVEGPQLLGTLTLLREDPVMWGPQAPGAGYVHRLAVRRSRAGEGLGRRLLEWADGVVRERGGSQLRLDCLESNVSLVNYYRGLGFRVVRSVVGNVPGESRASVLLERPVGASP